MVDCAVGSSSCRGGQWFKRISCPGCNFFKIRELCEFHASINVKRLKVNDFMHCSRCSHQGKVSDYWTVYQDREA